MLCILNYNLFIQHLLLYTISFHSVHVYTNHNTFTNCGSCLLIDTYYQETLVYAESINTAHQFIIYVNHNISIFPLIIKIKN